MRQRKIDGYNSRCPFFLIQATEESAGLVMINTLHRRVYVSRRSINRHSSAAVCFARFGEMHDYSRFRNANCELRARVSRRDAKRRDADVWAWMQQNQRRHVRSGRINVPLNDTRDAGLSVWRVPRRANIRGRLRH
jgi:hypothetical protein